MIPWAVSFQQGTKLFWSLGSGLACCHFPLQFVCKARSDEAEVLKQTIPVMEGATKSHCRDVEVVRGGELGLLCNESAVNDVSDRVEEHSIWRKQQTYLKAYRLEEVKTFKT